MNTPNGSIGRAGFAERHGLWNDDKAEAAADVERRVEALGLNLIRLSFPDQHGILRGKTLVASELPSAMRNGCGMVTSILAKDTSHKTVFPVFSEGGGFGMDEMTGVGDFLMLPDPTTFRVLPWAEKTGWLMCDAYFPNGKPVPFSTREIMRSALGDLAEAGYDYMSGLEVEFYLFRMADPMLGLEHGGQPPTPPQVELLAHGFQYLTELRYDEYDPYLEPIRRQLIEVGLPLRSMEMEFGPGQLEFTFGPGVGLDPPDQMIMFRNAMKQICRRQGLHVTFMCRPQIPNTFSSGWHLHQSLIDRKTGENAFVPGRDDEILSPVGRQFVAGILEHARAACVFTTPTTVGYDRFQPNSLAPNRAAWSHDNRGAMLRISGGLGDASTNIENRIGDPAANPYLYMTSQILAGLDAIKRQAEPPPPTDLPYEADAPMLPTSLEEALAALDEDPFYRAQMGDAFIDYIKTLKMSEVTRAAEGPEDWAQREYFELF